MTVERFNVRYLLIAVIASAAFADPTFASDGLVNSASLANNTGNKRSTPAQDRSVQDRNALDREAEAKAIRMVESHLPELNPILQRLREKEPREYAKAIRDLARSEKKLELASHRNDGSFEIEVEWLQAQTEVNLLSARLKVRDNARDRKQLKTAVTRLQNAQVAKAEHEVKVFRDRLARAQKLLDAAEQRLKTKQENSDDQIEKMYTGLIRKAGRELDPEKKTTRPNRRVPANKESDIKPADNKNPNGKKSESNKPDDKSSE